MSAVAYNRKGKVKLCKDLKYGKVHLRQSLIELDQIQDLDKMFRIRKDQFKIQDLEVKIENNFTQQNEQQQQYFLSPLQRIEMYKKQKINKKIKQKMNKYFQQKPIGFMRVRKPKTEKMLQNFQQKYRNEMPISCKQDLKQSEMNLSKIKKNDKRKFQLHSQNKKKPLYISRMNSEKYSKNAMYDQERQDNHGKTRKRFISLKTSLPQKQKEHCQYVRQIVQGRTRDEHKSKLIDIKNIDHMLDSYLVKKARKQAKLKADRQMDEKFTNNRSQMSAMGKIKTQNASSFHHARHRTKSNVEKSFKKSEQNSKQIIQTMSSFYQTKHHKKQMHDEMVENVRYDRPLTSSIRRKNYTVLGRESLSPIKQYRQQSQKQRKQIRNKNIQFYKSLLQGIETYHQQDIPTTIFVIQQVRRIVQSEYYFTLDILNDLVNTVSKMEIDTKTQDILDKIGAFVGYDITVLEEVN